MLLAEFAAWLAIAAWLSSRRGWQVAEAFLLVVGVALGVRLAIVCLSMAIAWVFRSPRPAGSRIGLAGTMRLVLGEWRAMLANNFFYLPLENIAVRPDPPLGRREAPPVLFVHGYLSNRGILRAPVRALERKGLAAVCTFDLEGVFVPIEELVGQLASKVEEVARASGQSRLILVCHSMGGLVARGYIAKHGAGRIAKLITIGSPHHGTALAYLGMGANARQMRRGSDFLEALRIGEGETGPGGPATSIYTLHDNLVAPQDTSRLSWARNVVLPGLGHIDILLSPRLHAVLLEELSEAGVEAAR
jgi:triacylglycerol esterase/lipase EstA (alpha/beta hydrolase family)